MSTPGTASVGAPAPDRAGSIIETSAPPIGYASATPGVAETIRTERWPRQSAGRGSEPGPPPTSRVFTRQRRRGHGQPPERHDHQNAGFLWDGVDPEEGS